MNLFQGEFIFLHSQEATDFKIDCDALTDEDLASLATVVSKKLTFGSLHPIPRGGERFAKALEKHITPECDTMLIVDDVCTTGSSFNQTHRGLRRQYKTREIKGICIFCRRPENKPAWVHSIFDMWSY